MNGVHSAPDLQRLMNVFIDKFVLCPLCHLPETALIVKKDFIFHKCSACGAREPADMSHKLCTFILREATAAKAAAELAEKEDAKKSKLEKKEKKDKKEKKEKKSKGEKAAASEEAGGDKVGEGAAAGGAGVSAASGADSGAEEDGTGVSAGVGAVSLGSTEAASGSTKAAAEEEEEAETEGAGMDAIRAVLTRTPAATVEEVIAEVKQQQINSGRPPVERAAMFLLAALPTGAVAAIKSARNQSVLKTLIHGKESSTPGAAQRAALLALQTVVVAGEKTLLKGTAGFLQALYDVDVLEEEAITAFYESKAITPAFKAAAQPFVEWLQTADESDEEEGA